MLRTNLLAFGELKAVQVSRMRRSPAYFDIPV